MKLNLIIALPVDDYYEKFYNIFKKIVYKFARLRKATRKEKQLHAKPWLTRGLLKSANHKNNLFKIFTKTTTKSCLKTTKTIAI